MQNHATCFCEKSVDFLYFVICFSNLDTLEQIPLWDDPSKDNSTCFYTNYKTTFECHF